MPTLLRAASGVTGAEHGPVRRPGPGPDCGRCRPAIRCAHPRSRRPFARSLKRAAGSPSSARARIGRDHPRRGSARSYASSPAPLRREPSTLERGRARWQRSQGLRADPASTGLCGTGAAAISSGAGSASRDAAHRSGSCPLVTVGREAAVRHVGRSTPVGRPCPSPDARAGPLRSRRGPPGAVWTGSRSGLLEVADGSGLRVTAPRALLRDADSRDRVSPTRGRPEPDTRP
jgi:hypothetical protein